MRFAPSPNGLLHRGHAYSALLNARWAARTGGTVLLRIENIDVARCTPVFEAAIMADLHWLGFDWVDPALRQSERQAAYAATLGRLAGDSLLYPCFCTRGDVARAIAGQPDWPRDPDGTPLYPGTCRHLAPAERAHRLAAGVPAAQRLDMTVALERGPKHLAWQEHHEADAATAVMANPAAWGDVLLARKDIGTSYHVAVVTDDAAQGITDVVRGADLFAATSLHRLLQWHLGLPEPAYHHHRVILDAAGHKLSKSRGSPSLQALRQDGATPASICASLGL